VRDEAVRPLPAHAERHPAIGAVGKPVGGGGVLGGRMVVSGLRRRKRKGGCEILQIVSSCLVCDFGRHSVRLIAFLSLCVWGRVNRSTITA
jgi:hypothetical protein